MLTMKLNKIVLWVLWAACLPALQLRADAGTDTARFHVQQWTTEQGLPDNGVKAIAQTPDGYLWIGTLNGLARFDGVSFTTFTRGNTPGLVSDAINALAVDTPGTLWLATSDGLVEWRGGVVKRWATAEGMPGGHFFGVLAARGGGVWWREGHWCGRLREGRITRYGAEHGLVTNRVWNIVQARDGGLIALTYLGVQRLDAGRERFGELLPWPVEGGDWRGWEDAGGRLWAGGNAGSFCRESNRWVDLSSRDGFGIGTKFFEDRTGRFWISSKGAGIRWMQPDGALSAPVLESEEQDISVKFADREGNLWATVGGGGLFRLRPQRIRAWTTLDGLPSNKVRSVSAGPDGSVWAATEKGLARIRAGRVETFSGIEPDSELGLQPVWADRSGFVWSFKWGHGLLRFDGRQFERRPVVPGVPGFLVNSLYEDRAGRLCAGFDRGVWVYDEGRFGPLFASNVVGHYIRAMLQDRAGRWWLGTKEGGVQRYDGEPSRPTVIFTTTNGLSDDRVTALHEDGEGAIWIGTEHGLNRFKDGRLTAILTSQGLPENAVYHLAEDDAGNLWWSGLRGIHRASRAQIDAVANGKTNRVACLSYGESDGMASSETNGELQPAGCKTPDGHLWFPTIKGVVEIDPRTLIDSEAVPPVVIEQVKADGEVEWQGSRNLESAIQDLRFAPGRARVLEIRFTANSLSAPEKVRFKWKLEPRDRDWHDAGAQRFVFLQNLRPRSYTFRVQACNQHGLWNEVGTGFAFSLAPHFWETWPFYFLCGVTILSLGASLVVVRLRVQRSILCLEHEQSLARERTRIARDLHDELGSRLTALAVRADMAGTAANGEGAKLRAFAVESRALAERMRDVIWAVDPECDSLEALVSRLTGQAEEFLGTTGVRLRLELPETLPALPLSAEARHQLTMIAKEALHNALKHSGATEVRLGVELTAESLSLRVSDNGAGFDAARPGGRGLANMRERLRALGGLLEIDSRTNHGTIIQATVPRAQLNNPSVPRA